jgi:organic radical activating enzyme
MQVYKINEIFHSIQGEGADTGEYSTFIRLAECNLRCQFCDTDIKTNYEMDMQSIGNLIRSRNIVITGGEPLLQEIDALVQHILWKVDWRRITVETNGTIKPSRWLSNLVDFSLSPKLPRSICKVKKARSLKILYPYLDCVNVSSWLDFPAEYKSLQVIDPEKGIGDAMTEMRLLPPDWHLGIQVHKLIGVK